MTAPLKRISIAPAEDLYRITLETEDGTTSAVTATFDQLDLIAEEIDRILDQDEESALSE